MADEDDTQSFFTLTSGTKVNQYRIVDKIGAGGMGEVYLAEDTLLGRKVALKFLPPRLSHNEAARNRFTREAKAAAKLDHPGIIPVFEVGEFQGRPFFSMAHVEGKSLRDVIKEGKLRIEEAIEITKQICEGLHKAHESGVVHRDIKPANVMIDKAGKARILDFGLATVAGEDKLTRTGSTLGTVGYMSPEQIEGKQVDRRSDLFSVGVMLYEMLTGRRPFQGETDAAVARSITDTNPEPIARYKSGVTGKLQQVVDKALTKDSSLRYQTAAGMLSDLKRLQLESRTQSRKSRVGLWAAVFAVPVIAAAFYLLWDADNDVETNTAGWGNSVAVLVFRNLSDEESQDIFCEGMTDEIIGRLSTIKKLKVTSMQSMLRFKDTELDMKAIGEELGVDNVLEGSIQRSGDEIRVRAQLIRVVDDAHIWSEKYDRKLESVFAIQDEISRSIADVLETKLVGAQETFAARRGTDDLEAYTAYITGRHFWRKRSEEGIRTAMEHFEKAIAIDNEYAQAWSGLADCWRMLPLYGDIIRSTAAPIADSLSKIAVSLGPDLAETHASRGLSLEYQNRLEESEREFKLAIELNPNYAWGQHWYSTFLAKQGRYEEQLRHLDIAYALDPLAAPILAWKGRVSRRVGNLDQAEAFLKRAIEMAPDWYQPYEILSNIYASQYDTLKLIKTLDEMMKHCATRWQAYASKARFLSGHFVQLDEAEQLYLRAVELAPENSAPYYRLGDFYMEYRGDLAKAEECFLKSIELDSLQPAPHKSYGHLLQLQGRMDESIEQRRIAMELAPFDAEMLGYLTNRIGLSYMLLRQYDRADSVFATMQSHPDSTQRGLAREYVAYPLFYQGKFAEASRVLREGIEIDLQELGPSLPLFRKYYTICENALLFTQNYAEAREQLDAMKSLIREMPSPSDNLRSDVSAMEGRVLAAEGDIDGGKQVIRDANETSSVATLKYHLASIHRRAGEYRESIELMKQYNASIDIFSGKLYLGVSYLGANEPQKAVEALEDAMLVWDDNRVLSVAEAVTGHYYLARAYEEVSRTKEAIEEYEIFLDIWKNADEGLEPVEDARQRLAALKRGP